MNSKINIRAKPIAGAFGAEIVGLHLDQLKNNQLAVEIRRML